MRETVREKDRKFVEKAEPATFHFRKKYNKLKIEHFVFEVNFKNCGLEFNFQCV